MTIALRRIARLSLLILVGLYCREEALALPRFSLVSGTRCSACHFTPHGGGIRTELGWSMMNEVGAFRWPWMKPKPSDAGEGGEDLFGAPPSGDGTSSDGTSREDAST